MSIEQIKTEIRRFLASPDPEVLCIKGKWGVGKTYCWKKYLNEANSTGDIALSRYSYVSVFGLNSLEDLRFSIFESTVSGDKIGGTPDSKTFDQLIGKGTEFSRKSKPMIEALSAFFNRKGLADVIFKSAFMTVQKQLICLDDLERAGSDLKVRDILGLASFLKEERHCKIVLLLNDKEHEEIDEFDRQLEKVADVTLIFDPSPSEAVEIALTGDDRAAVLLRPRICELGITNIRVIKKIERLAKRLLTTLEGLDDDLTEAAVATLVLASWSVQQPSVAPTLDFLKSYNRIAIAVRSGRDEVEPHIKKFREQIAGYPFSYADALDLHIIEGAAAGFFQPELLRQVAEEVQRDRKKRWSDSKFSQVWETLYHGSLATDDDEFLDALYQTAIDEASEITPVNINSAIRSLREYGRGEQADSVIANYVAAKETAGFEFFDIKRHHFSADDKLDDGLQSAFADMRKVFVDPRDPLTVLISVGERRSWNDADAALFAKQSEDDFVRMFEQLRGDNLRSSIEMVLAMGNGNDAAAQAVKLAAVGALRRIAKKSPLRARKVARFGIALDEPKEK